MTCTAFAFACALAPAAPVAAAAMDLSSMDCTKAPAMMMKPDAAMAMSGASMTTDEAFSGMMHPMMEHAAMMAGMELKCGKDPKAKAMAVKLLQQLDADGVADAKDILNTYNH